MTKKVGEPYFEVEPTMSAPVQTRLETPRTQALPGALPLAILESIADPVFVKDQRHRWLYVNDALCRLLGQPRHALIGRTDLDFFPREEVVVFWAKDAEVFATGRTNVNEETLTTADGDIRIIVTKKSIMQTDDGPVLVGIIRDITELREATSALVHIRNTLEARVQRRTREVEAANAQLRQAERLSTIGALTGGVAHDFNNLLAVIVLAADELTRHPGLDDTGRMLAEQTVEAATRGSELTATLLNQARRMPSRPGETAIADLAEATASLLAKTLGAGVSMEVIVGRGAGCAWVDPGQLQNALINLALNARDAMPDGGTITVTVHGDEQTVGVVVEDEGVGIPPDTLERVFEPFFSTKPAGEGTGLGLSSVAAFIDEAGGTRSVRSTVGVGTRFELRFPRCPGGR